MRGSSLNIPAEGTNEQPSERILALFLGSSVLLFRLMASEHSFGGYSNHHAGIDE
jgi:hypothetical protein